MTLAIGAASWVPRINGSAAMKQRHGLCWPAVASQGAQPGVCVIDIARIMEAAGVIAAEVVTVRLNRAEAAAAVAAHRVVRDDTVCEYRLTIGVNAAAIPRGCAVSANRGVIDGQRRIDKVIEDAAAGDAGSVPTDGAVVDGQRPIIINASAG